MRFGEAWLLNLQKWLGRRPITGEIDTAGSAKATRKGSAVGGSGKARSSASAGAEPGEKREGPLTIKCPNMPTKKHMQQHSVCTSRLPAIRDCINLMAAIRRDLMLGAMNVN